MVYILSFVLKRVLNKIEDVVLNRACIPDF